jgi:hypothetical protein
MVRRKKLWIIFSIIAGLVIITAIVVPMAIILPRKTDQTAATTTTMTMTITRVTASEEISLTTKGG